MLNDKILDWIFSRKEIQKLTVEEQSEFVYGLTKILEEAKNDEPDE